MSKTWLGTSLTDICKGQGPWSFHSSPILPSKYHCVLYQLPLVLDRVAQPRQKNLYWDDDHVRLPCSQYNLITSEDDETVLESKWNLICETLRKPIKSSDEFENAVRCYNPNIFTFGALHFFFKEVLDEYEATNFFETLLPKIINLALKLPEILPGNIPLLKKSHNRSLSLSQYQISCLLANAFLCTFPWRRDVAACYPGVNFLRLFAAFSKPKRISCIVEKLKCFINYFRRVVDKPPKGVVTFERKYLPRSHIPRWDISRSNLGNTRIHVTSEGTIEDGLGFLQMDFANKFIGGGVLGYGGVQEEIRFCICPELVIGRLFTEQLEDTEAVIITGAERYSNYIGYGDTFQWNGNNVDDTPFDEDGRRKTTIVVLDATHYNKPVDQFYPSAMLRELNKAYVGFSSREVENLAPIATGNWGCGAFRGDVKLKSLIQLMACNATKRDMVYYSFGNDEIRDELYNMHLFLATNGITTGELWRILCKFASSNVKQNALYSFIQQCHFDMRAMPSANLPLTDISHKSLTENQTDEMSLFQINDVIANSSEEFQTDDVIEPSQPEREFRSSRFKPLSLKQKNVHKTNHSDVVKMFEVLDGHQSKNKSNGEGFESFLNIIDRMKKPSTSSSAMDVNKHESQGNLTEVVVDEMKPTSQKSLIKSKITDYFRRSQH